MENVVYIGKPKTFMDIMDTFERESVFYHKGIVYGIDSNGKEIEYRGITTLDHVVKMVKCDDEAVYDYYSIENGEPFKGEWFVSIEAEVETELGGPTCCEECLDLYHFRDGEVCCKPAKKFFVLPEKDDNRVNFPAWCPKGYKDMFKFIMEN